MSVTWKRLLFSIPFHGRIKFDLKFSRKKKSKPLFTQNEIEKSGRVRGEFTYVFRIASPDWREVSIRYICRIDDKGIFKQSLRGALHSSCQEKNYILKYYIEFLCWIQKNKPTSVRNRWLIHKTNTINIYIISIHIVSVTARNLRFYFLFSCTSFSLQDVLDFGLNEKDFIFSLIWFF